ncbi:hypothetical protein LTR50_002997 [Elasticomyces elasticus]|nr:hypothetical protein LTR50_002997 [Elasticomyces elasticus]
MSTSDPSIRPIYSHDQLIAYYDRIALPEHHHHTPGEKSKAVANSAAGLDYLAALQRYTLSSIPFENLELHYSRYRLILIDPQSLYDKIIARGNGRGGYCMENNCFFETCLRSLGFQVMSTGARVNEGRSFARSGSAGDGWEGPKYGGWAHMINIVTIQNNRYMVDVGFGSSGPTHPIPLIHNQPTINVPPNQWVRLDYANIPDNTSTDQKLWAFEYRNSESDSWMSNYCFSELEFLPSDYAVMNHFTSTSRTSFFTYSVICVRMVMEDDRIVGDVTLFNKDIKRRIAGKSEVLVEIASEDDRVKALDRYLGVRLSDAEKSGIGKTTSAIS